MKLGVFYHHVKMAAEQNQMTIGEAFDFVKDQGIDYLELDRDALKDFDNDPAALYDALSAHGLQGSNLCWYYPWEKTKDDLEDYLMIKAAKVLHLERVMPIPGLYTGPDKDPAELEQMVVNMQKLAVRALDEGLQFCIEDYDNELSAIATMEGMQYFRERVPGLTIAFDTGNFLFAAQDVLEAFELLKDGIVHVHVKDRSRVKTNDRVKVCVDGSEMYPCPVGAGVIPVEKIITMLTEKGYQGVYTMEFYDSTDYKESILESVKYMKALAEKTGA